MGRLDYGRHDVEDRADLPVEEEFDVVSALLVRALYGDDLDGGFLPHDAFNQSGLVGVHAYGGEGDLEVS